MQSRTEVAESIHSERERANCRHLFAAYAALIAFGTIVHLANSSCLSQLSHHSATALAALWVMQRPGSVFRFAILSALQIVSFVGDLPFVVNHWIMLAVMNLSVLGALGLLAISDRDRVSDGGQVFLFTAPVLRVQIIVMYWCAAIAKMNHDFIDPELSAAAALYRYVAERLFLPVDGWIIQSAIWGTILLEVVLPALLIMSRTRTAGVVIACGFHFVMAISGHVAFSALAIAFLLLFVPIDLPECGQAIVGRSPRLSSLCRSIRRVAVSPFTLLVIAYAWAMLVYARSIVFIDRATAEWLTHRSIQLSYALLATVTGLVFVACVWWQGASRHEPHPFRSPVALLNIFPCLLVLNALCPYLGLKTESSFTMFSNLRTEADRWNHLFMPRALRVFAYQDDLVRILASNDPRLHKSAVEGEEWVHFEYRRYLSQHPEISVAFEHRDQRYELERAGDHADFAEPPSLWMHKFFWFRPVLAPDRNTIQH